MEIKDKPQLRFRRLNNMDKDQAQEFNKELLLTEEPEEEKAKSYTTKPEW